MARISGSRSYHSHVKWELEWAKREPPIKKQSDKNFKQIAANLESEFGPIGFRLFNNGGLPLLERHRNHIREEVLLLPAPRMLHRPDLPFAVRVHVSSAKVAKVRSRFWRPACRAPQIVAVGDIGELGLPPRHLIFSAADPTACTNHLIEIFDQDVLAWFRAFHYPLELRERLHVGMPLVNSSTAMELLLSEFSADEARLFMNMKDLTAAHVPGPIREIEGYDLGGDRVAPIKAYYGL
jgi:hypothetical protein